MGITSSHPSGRYTNDELIAAIQQRTWFVHVDLVNTGVGALQKATVMATSAGGGFRFDALGDNAAIAMTKALADAIAAQRSDPQT